MLLTTVCILYSCLSCVLDSTVISYYLAVLKEQPHFLLSMIRVSYRLDCEGMCIPVAKVVNFILAQNPRFISLNLLYLVWNNNIVSSYLWLSINFIFLSPSLGQFLLAYEWTFVSRHREANHSSQENHN